MPRAHVLARFLPLWALLLGPLFALGTAMPPVAVAAQTATTSPPAATHAAAIPPWEPEARNGTAADAWLKQHERFLATAAPANPDLLFLGDSITADWLSKGKVTWQSDYAPRRAFDLGIGGDTTQNVLWRIANGELDGISPRVTVLLIGTNDIGGWTPEEVAHGVSAIIDAVHAKLPATQIMLLGIFPRSFNANAPQRARITEANALLATFAGIGTDAYLRYLDIGAVFLEPDGSIAPTVMADGLHPTAEGYMRWASAMDPTLDALLAP